MFVFLKEVFLNITNVKASPGLVLAIIQKVPNICHKIFNLRGFMNCLMLLQLMKYKYCRFGILSVGGSHTVLVMVAVI